MNESAIMNESEIQVYDGFGDGRDRIPVKTQVRPNIDYFRISVVDTDIQYTTMLKVDSVCNELTIEFFDENSLLYKFLARKLSVEHDRFSLRINDSIINNCRVISQNVETLFLEGYRIQFVISYTV